MLVGEILSLHEKDYAELRGGGVQLHNVRLHDVIVL
jgi:hypothetical protein